jgi:small subunit ribosomal protein S15
MNRLPLRSTGVVFRRLLSTTPEAIPTKAPLPAKTPLKLLGLNVPYPKHIENVFSLATANQEEITAHRISLAIAKYKKHDSDTGSAIVQLAVMTEKIYNLARHFAMHKKDKAGGRGFQVIKRITARLLHMSFLMLNIILFLIISLLLIQCISRCSLQEEGK